MDVNQEVFVYENWSSNTPKLVGKLYIDQIRGNETCSFEYNDDWLIVQEKQNYIIDPDLPMYRGRQYVPVGKKIFGIFSDTCPDRWGRRLLDRREIINAAVEKRKPRKLMESDYLLGVLDEARMGAIRLSIQEKGSFLAADRDFSVPPWTTLRQLEEASREYEKDDNFKEDKWLKQLVAPGSSLGGARPKACVKAPDGSLWIAKFPSKNDDIDISAWEMVVHDLALKCNLNVPEAMLEKLSKYGSTYLVKRFDRDGERRRHFASAMTMLGAVDGQSDNYGYLDIAEFLKSNSVCVTEDLHELWARIVFSMCVSNTDDHLRNHGFILTGKGWRLSPMYDVNPSLTGDTLSLMVTENDNRMDFELALKISEYFGMKRFEAEIRLSSIKSTVKDNWKYLAYKYGIKRNEVEIMASAFEKT